MADDIDPKLAAKRRAAGRASRGGTDAPARARPATPPAPMRSPRPSPSRESLPAVRPSTSVGGNSPPPRPPASSRTLSSTPAPRPGMPPLRPGAMPRMGGGIPALIGAGAGALAENVQRNYPRVLETEQEESAREGVSTRAFDAPARVPGRVPARIREPASMGSSPLGGNTVPARDPRPLDPEEQTGPRGSGPRRAPEGPPAPTRPPAPRRPAPRGGMSEADILNAAELGRIERVKAGDASAHRPPQFAKGGMIKKPAKPSIGKIGGGPGRPPAPPKSGKLPAFLSAKSPKAPKPPALPFAKGGMPKGKR